MAFNIDADPGDADWTKQTGWDLPITTDAFVSQVLGFSREAWADFKRLPAYQAMPKALAKSVDLWFGPRKQRAADDRRRSTNP